MLLVLLLIELLLTAVSQVPHQHLCRGLPKLAMIVHCFASCSRLGFDNGPYNVAVVLSRTQTRWDRVLIRKFL